MSEIAARRRSGGRPEKGRYMFLSLGRRDESDICGTEERWTIFRVPGKRVNENFILLTQSAAAVVMSHTHAHVPPPPQKKPLFSSSRPFATIIISSCTVHPPRRRIYKKKNQINDLFLGGGARGPPNPVYCISM